MGGRIARFDPPISCDRRRGSLVAAIVAPWFVAVSIREPGFFDFYFIGEHFRRFFDSSFSHGEPIYYYFPVILGGLLPWSC